MEPRKPYPSDATDDEWAFLVPYLTLMREDASPREYALRDLFDGLRWLIKTGAQWRFLPHHFPPWHAVYQQARRWHATQGFEAMTHDLREILRLADSRAHTPSAAILDGRTIQSTPESGERGGSDGHKRRKGSKVHVAVDTLGQLLALVVTAASDQERDQGSALSAAVQEATGQTVTLSYGDQGYTGDQAAADAAAHGIRLEVVKHSEAKKGSCCCHGVGWWSGRSCGSLASAVWRGTTNGWPQPSRVALGRLSRPHAPSTLPIGDRKCITGSRDIRVAAG